MCRRETEATSDMHGRRSLGIPDEEWFPKPRAAVRSGPGASPVGKPDSAWFQGLRPIGATC